MIDSIKEDTRLFVFYKPNVGNKEVDIQPSVYDIYMPEVPVELEVISDSREDRENGEGAKVLTLVTLGPDFEIQTNQYIINGLEPVAIHETHRRIVDARVTLSGKLGTNIGEIRIQTKDTKKVMGVILPGQGACFLPYLTVPKGYEYAVFNCYCSNRKMDWFAYKIRLHKQNTWTMLVPHWLTDVPSGFRNYTLNYLPEGTDLKIVGQGINKNSYFSLIVELAIKEV